MKHKIITSVAIACMAMSGGMRADAHSSGDDVNYFEVSSSIAQPVTIKTNLGTYKFSGKFTLYGHISSIEAFDAHGNKITNTQPYKYSSSGEHWYRFSSIYQSYDWGSDNSYSSSSSTGQTLGNAMWNSMTTFASFSDYSLNIQARAGWSKYIAENLSLRFCCGAAFMSASIGKDCFNDDGITRWSIGIGSRLCLDQSDWSFAVKFMNKGKGKIGYHDGPACALDVEWTFWPFEDLPWLGFFVNAGIGAPCDKTYTFDTDNAFLDFQTGVALTLAY